ncbi:MAG TPA: threonine synthase [Acidobacteriaceae bacterium]|nr:threonine synthase [Acidobacteriaceae bacterium]
MSPTHQLRCTNCGTRIAAESAANDFRCPDCHGLYEVIYPWSPGAQPSASAQPDPSAIPANLPNPNALRYRWQELRTSTLPIDQSGVWRFRDLLPIVSNLDNVVTLHEGNTPLYTMPRCAKIAGIDWLFAKHQGMNPTGSFKDTGMTAAISVAVERGYKWVACASTGNTSAAMAAYAARAGLRSIVFIPEGKIAWGKLSQSMDYGALTVQLKTDFDGCLRLLIELVKRFPIYLLNSVNPYRLEGQKTPALEILEQLEGQVPEHLIVPGGNLANSSALGKGFLEMKHIGLIPRVPKISVIQAEGANPLYRWFNDTNKEMLPVTADTRATAIRIGNPASWQKSSRIIEETGGWCEQATEQEIALAKAEIGAEGIGCEPASAVTFAGLKKLIAQGRVSREERTVLLLTGHTLKDSQYTIDYHRNELLTPAELAGATATERLQHEALRKPPMVLDADENVVLRALEQRMALSDAADRETAAAPH